MNSGLHIPDRRGLSELVSSLLLILVVLIAIAILWAFIRPTSEKGAEQVGIADDCLKLRIEPVRCTYGLSCLSGTERDNAYVTTVWVRRTGNEALQDIAYIFTDAQGDTRVIYGADATYPGPLPGASEQSLAGVVLADFVPVRVQTTPVVGNSHSACTPLTAAISCQRDSNEAQRCADIARPSDTEGDGCGRANGVIDSIDISCFLNKWTRQEALGDFNRDGFFTPEDVLAYCAAYRDEEASGC